MALQSMLGETTERQRPLKVDSTETVSAEKSSSDTGMAETIGLAKIIAESTAEIDLRNEVWWKNMAKDVKD